MVVSGRSGQILPPEDYQTNYKSRDGNGLSRVFSLSMRGVGVHVSVGAMLKCLHV